MLSNQQISEYKESGYLILEKLLRDDLFHRVDKAIEEIEAMEGPEFFREKKSGKIRTIFAPEKFHPEIQQLIDNEEIRGIVSQLLETEFYLFQSKLNSKASLQSGVWSWHQDFKFWKEDGMLEAEALTLAIFLTDVDVANGPILAIPGSQKYGEVESYLNNPDGVHDENLKYLIRQETLAKMVTRFGPITPLTGKAGDAVIFSSNILHGSYQNMGIVDRKLLMFTFNPTRNIQEVGNPRPDYMVKREKRVLNPKP
ncbi:phytanoyl-CoA dioxygenase family protein [Algoriphagus sediminis]|uniref:Phytanoyl-CoA dioxygenase family protein n=1 Tax=Algoriphagus sediminis TaxID=3057113 RepID=A0ABT7YCZ4_9BACT|nr:phytanoyl-CoA dioxygenase family protein [Algoriphagus sediminis]MDN3204394.1 phytanoyl-CoA dioxygenase family protein [Algoriphagus sediminis]